MASLLDFVYYGGLLLASPWLLAKVLPARGRRHLAGLRERLGACPRRPGDRPCVWVHAVSVGEVRAAAPLVDALARELPGVELVLSTTTSTGQEVARKAYPGLRVIHYPLDLSFAVRSVLRAVRPDLVVLVELEVWPTFLLEAHRRHVPVVVVNGRITERSVRGYRLLRHLGASLSKIARLCAQTDTYAARFRALGIDPRRIEVTGSLKYDLVQCDAQDGAAVRAEVGLGAGDTVLIGGSTHRGEEQALLAAFRALRERRSDLRLVLVPRHTERRDEVRALAAELAPGVVLRSGQRDRGERGVAGGAATEPLAPGHVLLVDTVGELGRLYAAADLVFVGGSLIPHGGQNVLEPAAYGKPTLFGPSWHNFQEPGERLLAARGAREVRDPDDLRRALGELLADPQAARTMGERGRAAVLAARGATARTVAVLRDVLAARERRRRGPGPAGR